MGLDMARIFLQIGSTSYETFERRQTGRVKQKGTVIIIYICSFGNALIFLFHYIFPYSIYKMLIIFLHGLHCIFNVIFLWVRQAIIGIVTRIFCDIVRYFDTYRYP
jgi:hypothetical protein